MTEFYTTSLGDYLSLMASKEGIPKSDLEKRVDIKEISAIDAQMVLPPREKALKDFEERSREYDAVVDIIKTSSRAIFGLDSAYEIQGTGVKLNKPEEKK